MGRQHTHEQAGGGTEQSASECELNKVKAERAGRYTYSECCVGARLWVGCVQGGLGTHTRTRRAPPRPTQPRRGLLGVCAHTPTRVENANSDTGSQGHHPSSNKIEIRLKFSNLAIHSLGVATFVPHTLALSLPCPMSHARVHTQEVTQPTPEEGRGGQEGQEGREEPDVRVVSVEHADRTGA